ncbi:short chain dehydrogenase family protein [Mycobacterium xenopi 4042]|uniref:Short chain dehydrogenase family protein n=1 Tax=Mycobacterium xenopi 4042 TaxID=1299334 RepID=X7Z4V5_MYCXE|nr:short chain dehydrogenase family protein [Mycobacterium xenopi 4042]
MIDFTGQVAIVTGAGGTWPALCDRTGPPRRIRGGQRSWGSMHGEGSDATVADKVVEEIERSGGTAVASHVSVDSPEGGEAIVRTAVDRFDRLDAVVSNAGIFNSIPFEELSPGLAPHAECAPGRRLLSEPARVPGDEEPGLRPVRFHLVVGRAVRPAAGSPLRRGQSRPGRADERHRDRRRRARDLG